eukprot:3411648-Pyramimonas_sp.AAC.1
MRHHYQSVRHRPSSCPSDLRSGGSKKIGKRQETVFRARQIPIRKRQPDLILLAPPARPPAESCKSDV